MNKRGYQADFASNHSEMYVDEQRARKANTLRLILFDVLGEKLAKCTVLNIGCSTGMIDGELAPHVGRITGIDIDATAIEFAKANHPAANLEFRVGDAMNVDAADCTFDVVICAQVYEHVPDAKRLMVEIDRVLKPGGVCYFAATNRLKIMEEHYHLPFLSIIPVFAANLYLRSLGRGRYYYERHLTLGQLRKLVQQFNVEDVTPRLLAQPAHYGAEYMLSGSKLSVARFIQRVAYWAFPGFIWLLWKASDPEKRKI